MAQLLKLGVGDLLTALTMPADFGINLLAGSVPARTPDPGPRTSRSQTTDNGQPVWQTKADGSRTMRITSMDQLYKIFPKSTDEQKGLRV